MPTLITRTESLERIARGKAATENLASALNLLEDRISGMTDEEFNAVTFDEAGAWPETVAIGVAYTELEELL